MAESDPEIKLPPIPNNISATIKILKSLEKEKIK